MLPKGASKLSNRETEAEERAEEEVGKEGGGFRGWQQDRCGRGDR